MLYNYFNFSNKSLTTHNSTHWSRLWLCFQIENIAQLENCLFSKLSLNWGLSVGFWGQAISIRVPALPLNCPSNLGQSHVSSKKVLPMKVFFHKIGLLNKLINAKNSEDCLTYKTYLMQKLPSIEKSKNHLKTLKQKAIKEVNKYVCSHSVKVKIIL